MHRRDLLRWGGYLGIAALVGCRPSDRSHPAATGGAAGDAARAAPSAPAPASPPGPPLPQDGLDPERFPEDGRGSPATGDGAATDDPVESASDGAAEGDPPGGEPSEPAADQPTDRDPDDASAAEEHAKEPEPEETADTSLRVEVICRDALGLAPASGGARSHTITRLTLHHTQVPLGDNRLAPGRLRGHQSYHQEQGWSDIAYHFGVDLRGNVYELRDPATAGDTFTAYDPAGHYLVVCEGDYDMEQPTDAMLQATAAILAHGVQHYGAAADTLTGHRDHASVTCPGRHLYARLGDLRDEVARLARATPEVASLCGSAGRDRVAAIEAG